MKKLTLIFFKFFSIILLFNLLSCGKVDQSNSSPSSQGARYTTTGGGGSGGSGSGGGVGSGGGSGEPPKPPEKK